MSGGAFLVSNCFVACAAYGRSCIYNGALFPITSFIWCIACVYNTVLVVLYLSRMVNMWKRSEELEADLQKKRGRFNDVDQDEQLR